MSAKERRTVVANMARQGESVDDMCAATGGVSRVTIRKDLRAAGFSSYSTLDQRQRRIQWAASRGKSVGDIARSLTIGEAGVRGALGIAAPPRTEPPRPCRPADPLEAYLAELHAAGRSPYTLRNYRNDIGAFLAWCRDRCLDSLAMTRQVFRQYIAALCDDRIAAASITRKTSTIHGFYRYLQCEGIVDRDLLYGLSLPRHPKRLPKVLDPADVVALLEAPDRSPQGLRDRAMLELLYGGGLRIAELVGLDVGDVDRKAATAIVRGKGDRERLVLFGKPAMEALNAYLPKARRTFFGPEASRALFLNRFGGRLTGRWVQVMIKRYALVAGIDRDVWPHLLRHSFATHMFDGGADLRIIQDLLGHQFADSTVIYTHVSQAQQAKVSAAAWERLRPSPVPTEPVLAESLA